MSGSSGQSQVIREFLMKLGYAEDEASRRKFTDAIANMTKLAVSLGTAVATAATGVVAGVSKMADSMASLHYASERTKSSITAIGALRFAFSQLGSTAEKATSLYEGIAKMAATEPGKIGLIESLTGKPYTDAVQATEDLLNHFKEMHNTGAPEWLTAMQAGQVGIDLESLQVGERDIAPSMAEYRRRAQGDDQDEMGRKAVRFQQIVGSLRSTIDQMAQRLGAALYDSIGGDLTKLQTLIDTHKKEINAAIIVIADGIKHAGEVIVQFGVDCANTFGAVKGWYDKLTPANQGLVEGIAALAGGILAFRSGPLGAFIVTLGAIVELYKDFQKYNKEGGDKNTLVPWSKLQPALDGLTNVGKVLNENLGLVTGWKNAFIDLGEFLATVWVGKMLFSIGKIALALSPITMAMGVFAGSVAAGYSIAHAIDEALSDNDKAKQMAEGMGLEWSYGDFGHGKGYRDKSGKIYSTDQLAGMYNQRRATDSATQAKMAREGFDQYIAMGATPEIAAALIAQEKRESGFDPNAIGDNGEARGLYQHHKDRRDKILAGIGIDMANASAEDQRKGVWWEAHNTEKDAFAKMLSATNAGGAGYAATRYYERPGDVIGQGQLGAQLATEYFNEFTKPRAPTPTPTPSLNVGPNVSSLLYTNPAMLGGGGTTVEGDTTNTNHNTHNYNLTVNGVGNSDSAVDRLMQELRRTEGDRARNAAASPAH